VGQSKKLLSTLEIATNERTRQRRKPLWKSNTSSNQLLLKLQPEQNHPAYNTLLNCQTRTLPRRSRWFDKSRNFTATQCNCCLKPTDRRNARTECATTTQETVRTKWANQATTL